MSRDDEPRAEADGTFASVPEGGFNGMFEPGQRVRNPAQPDWGLGQVQSVVGDRVTANFDNAGKLLINVAVAPLDIVDE